MQQPVSFILIGIMIIIYVTPINNYNNSNELVNYFIRNFYHGSNAHLIANMVSFYYLSGIEKHLGSEQYLFIIFFIWIVSTIILYTIHYLIPSMKVKTIGFSGIVFGLVVVMYRLMGMTSGKSLMALVLSILPQVVVPGISFEGHLSGIIAGAIYVNMFME